MEIVRDPYLDIVKGMLILFVVFGHMLESGYGAMGNTLYHFIYSFHMPLFIFISGYLTKSVQSPKDFFLRNNKLLETFVIFQVVFCLLNIC